MFIEDHLNGFKAASIPASGWLGMNLQNWANLVVPSLGTQFGFANRRYDRQAVREFCIDRERSDEACFLFVMAWGGMRPVNARRCWKEKHSWLSHLRQLREGQLSRRQAYEGFASLRREGKLPGVRPAYFTKLIFFLRPSDDGYIMDQWTGKSVNLLTGKSLVCLDFSGHVSDKTSAQCYESFCLTVEQLSACCGFSPSTTEERLFSVGGRNPGDWRKHVKKNYGKPKSA